MRFLVLLLFSSAVFAQDVHYCDIAGKRVISDTPCHKLGGTTNTVRPADSFAPKTGLGGLTPGELRLADEYRQRDAAENARLERERAQRSQLASQRDIESRSRCKTLTTERAEVLASARMNSTQWHRDRVRDIDLQMAAIECARK